MGELTRRSLFGVLVGAAAVAALPIKAAGRAEPIDAKVPDDANDLLVRVSKDLPSGRTYVSARLFCYDGKLTHYHCDHPLTKEAGCSNGVPYPTRKYAIRYAVDEDMRERLRRRRGEQTYRSFLDDLKTHAVNRVRQQEPQLLVPEGGRYFTDSIPYEIGRKYGFY